MLTAVLCDSVLGGKDNQAQPVRAALLSAGLSSEMQVSARPGRLLGQQLEMLDTVIAAQPDLVVISHGGAESLKEPRPAGAGVLERMPQPTVGRFTRVTRRNRATRMLRRAARYERNRRRTSAVPFEEFAAVYRQCVHRLLAETPCRLILIGPVGGSSRYFPNDPRFVEAWAGFVEELGGESSRTDVIQPRRFLSRWDDYTSDRSHLSTSGQRALATRLAQLLQRQLSA